MSSVRILKAISYGFLLVAATDAAAAPPSQPSQQILCVKKSGGAVVARTGNCAKNELPYVGAQGPIGPTGPAGAIGTPGEQGVAGVQGLPGPQGPAGLQGPVGPQGEPGPRGPKGDQGPAGSVGEKGAAGPAGPQGEQGLKGDKGDRGAQGVQGAAGPIGPIGPQGLQGETGSPGLGRLGFFDSHGQRIGTFANFGCEPMPYTGTTYDYASIVIDLSGVSYLACATQTSISPNAQISYSSDDCTGAAYIDEAYLNVFRRPTVVPQAVIDYQGIVYLPEADQVATTIRSRKSGDRLCISLGAQNTLLWPLKPIGNVAGFVAPFSVK